MAAPFPLPSPHPKGKGTSTSRVRVHLENLSKSRKPSLLRGTSNRQLLIRPFQLFVGRFFGGLCPSCLSAKRADHTADQGQPGNRSARKKPAVPINQFHFVPSSGHLQRLEGVIGAP